MTTTKLEKTIGVLCVAGLMGAAAIAQEAVLQGPFKLSAGGGVAYTDNRDSSADDFAEETMDFSVFVRMGLLKQGDAGSLDFSYMPTFRHRTDPAATQNENELQHNLDLFGIRRVAPRLSVFGSEKFNLTDDPSVDEGGATLRRDSSFIINRLRAGVSVALSKNSTMAADVNHMIKRYDDDTVAVFGDEDSFGGGMRIGFTLSPTLTLALLGNVSDFNYETATYADSDVERGYMTYFGGLGVQKIMNQHLRVGGQAGWKVIEYDDSSVDSSSEPYLSADATISTIPSVRLMFGASYSLRDSDVFPFQSQTFTDAHARFEVDATKRLTLGVAGAYRIGKYDSDTLPEGVTAQDLIDRGFAFEGDEESIVAGADVALHLAYGLEIKVAQQYEDVDSDVGTSFTRNTTSLTAAKKF